MKQIGKTKYSVTKSGKIINNNTGRVLKLHNNGNGYSKVTLTVMGVQIQKNVHRLVAMHYVDNPENKKQVNHKNGIKSDNRASNLEWVTNSENQIHAHKTGLKSNGINLWNAKFNNNDIKKIFELDKTTKRKDIALEMKCCKSTISDILNGKRYKYIFINRKGT